MGSLVIPVVVLTMYPLILLSLIVGLSQAYTVTNADHFMFKNIDPLVIPGKYTSHMHDFFGSDAINVNTKTSAELQGGCTTAENLNDFSTYCEFSLKDTKRRIKFNSTRKGSRHSTTWTDRIIPQSSPTDSAPTTRSSIAPKSQFLKI